LGDIGRDEVFTQNTFGWTGLFHLGNHRRLARCDLAADRAQKITGQ
jgi:hypothetical protein